MSSNYLTVILVTVTIHSANSIFLPPNLMLESFNSKIPVYNSLSRILETTVLGSNNINISVPTLIIVVLVNVVIAAIFGSYVKQLGLARHGHRVSRRGRDVRDSDLVTCLSSADTNEEYSQCLSRSACESPSRAMSLVTAASLVTGTSSKYSGLVSLVRDAAQHGLGGGDCNTL